MKCKFFARHLWTLWVVVGLLHWFLCDASASPPSRNAEQVRALRAQVLFSHGLSMFRRGHYDAAIAAFLEAKRVHVMTPKLRYYLSRAYLSQGDLYAAQGQLAEQRRLYKQALELDPRLLNDPLFVQKYRRLQTQAADSLSQEHRWKRPPFKQRSFGIGLGLTLGVEGLLGIQVGVLLGGMVNPLVTFSPVQQSLDLAVRVIPLRWLSWSPYVSAGVSLPLPFEGFFGRSLSLRAPILHATIGAHYVAPIGLTFVTGLSFIYDLSPQTDTPFLPIPSVQLAWYI